MSHASETVPSAARDIRPTIGGLLDEAIGRLEQVAAGSAPDVGTAVHDVRKRCKDARALAKLLGSVDSGRARRFDAAVRDTGRTVGALRDVHVVADTLDALSTATRGRTRTAIRSVRRDGDHDPTAETPTSGELEHAIALLRSARAELDRWRVIPGSGPLVAGVVDAYGLGRRRLDRLRSTNDDEHLHEWRKAVKRLWYQSRAVQAVAPSSLRPMTATLDALSELLGDDHDLAMLVEHLRSDRYRAASDRDVERTIDAARARQAHLRERSVRLGATLYAEAPRAFRRRIESYWALTLELGPEPRVER